VAGKALARAENEREGQNPKLVDQIMRKQGLQQNAAPLCQQRRPVLLLQPSDLDRAASPRNATAFVQVSGSEDEVATYLVTRLKLSAIGSLGSTKGQCAAKISYVLRPSRRSNCSKRVRP
jgi:hypothetical protein